MDHTAADASALDRRILLGAAGLAGLAALTAGRAHAGPLNPPAGAIGGTGRTLDEVYNRIPTTASYNGRTPIPGGSVNFFINTPGSYILTGNLAVTSTNPLNIVATGVDVDLNGFTISAMADLTAIIVNGRSIRIHSGQIRECYHGVNLFSSASVVVEDVRFDRCRFAGIQATTASRGNVYRRCVITDTGANTVSSDGTATVRGINLAGNGNVASECAIYKVSSAGAGALLRGIEVSGTSNTVSRCTVTNDTAGASVGVLMSGSALYRDNTVLGFGTSYSGGTNGGGNA